MLAYTEDRIEDLLPVGSITADTRLVLANAIYLKASWSAPFAVADTANADFHSLAGATINVPTMNADPLMGAYTAGDGWVAMQLPYVGEQLAMGVLLPAEGRFAEIEATFDGDLLDAVLEDLEPAELTVALPKFWFEDDFDLIPPMRALGMAEAFTGSADFSRMSTEASLMISGIFRRETESHRGLARAPVP